jgi:hypothetical protein
MEAHLSLRPVHQERITKDQVESPKHNQEKVQPKSKIPVVATATALPLQTCVPLVLCNCESKSDKLALSPDIYTVLSHLTGNNSLS